MKYTLCIYPIAPTSVVVELLHRSLVVLFWQDAVSVLHNPSSSPRGNVCASGPTIYFFSQWLLLSCYLYIAHRLIQLKWSLNPIESIPNFMHIIKRMVSWEAEGIWMGFCRWEQWDTGMLRHVYQVSWLGEFLWLSLTTVSKCDYIFKKALGPCYKLWAPLNRVFLWMGVCIDLHIHTHLPKWLIADVEGRTQLLAFINQSTRSLAPRKLKQRDQEKHLKTDELPCVKGLGNTCTRDF